MNSYQRGQNLLCGGYSSYTPTGKSYFVKSGRWGKVPHYGDVVYFYTSSLGQVSHVGIVEDVKYGNGLYMITTIEGNTAAGVQFERDGGSVARKSYEFLPSQVGGANRINGFGTPDFNAETCGAGQFVSMAASQIGYVEKASNKNLDEFRANPGDGNYTKYGAWYGLNPAQWCQMFVSWCAYKACEQAHEYKPGWIQQDSGWMYRKPDGEFAADEWQYINGRWYVFDGSGKMITGWFKQGEDWFYLADDGGMCSSQWISEREKSYYLTASGIMARNAYIRSDKPYRPGAYIYYWVGEDGAWDPAWDTEVPHLDVYELAK